MNSEPWVVRLARSMAARPALVAGCWLLVVLAAVSQIPSFTEHETPRTARVEGSESAHVEHLLSTAFPHLGPEAGVIAFHSPTVTVDDPRYRTLITGVALGLQGDPAVQRTVSPFSVAGRVSADRHTALAGVLFRGDKDALQREAPRLQDVVHRSASLFQREAGLEAEAYLVSYSGVFSEIVAQEQAGTRRAELIGVPVALLLLLLATGGVVAACVPVLVAAAGVLVAFGTVGALSAFTGFDSTLETIIPMMGLALGIDYSLFVVSRFRAEQAARRTGREPPSPAAVREAVAEAMRHAGTTITLSGVVFVLGMSGLLFIQAPTIRQIGVGAMIAAACTLLAGLTLLPALLALLGHRLEKGRMPWAPGRSPTEKGSPRCAAFARRVMRRPVLVGVLTVGALCLCALPTLNLRLGVDLGVPAIEGQAVGKGQHIIEEAFAPGRSMPIEIVYTTAHGALTQRDLDAVDRLGARLAQDPAVHSVDSVATLTAPGAAPVRATPASLRITSKRLLVSADARSTVLSVAPVAASDSSQATELVTRLRARIVPEVLADAPGARGFVGGLTAAHLDLSDETTGKLWPVIAFVLLLSFLFLVAVFRSVLVPVKAFLMNALGTLAAYGLTVWVFQSGHLAGLLGFTGTGTGTIQAFLPLLTFVFLFAVSMDYELFLVRRIQEAWRRTGDNTEAVVEGMAHTAVPISAAAAVMTAVFGSFVLVDVVEIKQIGFALAVAVVLDVTLVRMLLLPAVMRLAGRANWWFPRFGRRAVR
ncbi:MMPL family transporter [Streptomyces sp. NPDC046261]|uniref:MMPL family transporter n=1 Tax=Streptomyces sp. NPDC046261 TaxID=3157200 RepID=UPI0033FB1A0A